MGERLLCKQEVVGSIPSASTRNPGVEAVDGHSTIRRKEPQHGNVGQVGRRPTWRSAPQRWGLERDHGQREEDM